MILLRQRSYSDTFEERLFRNKANREATRRWQMQEAGKNHIPLGDKGKAQLQEAYNTPLGGRGAGRGYEFGQASGPNGVQTVAERQSDLLQEARRTKTTNAVNSKGKLMNNAVAGSNVRGSALSTADGTVVGTDVALRSANDSLANKGDMTDRTRNLSEKRKRELAERRNARAQSQAQPQAPTQNPTAPNPNPAPTKPQTPNKPQTPSKPTVSSSPAAQKPSGFISKNMQRAGRLFKGTSRYGKAGQIAAIGTTALAAGGLGYGAYKAVKNKNQNNK